MRYVKSLYMQHLGDRKLFICMAARACPYIEGLPTLLMCSVCFTLEREMQTLCNKISI